MRDVFSWAVRHGVSQDAVGELLSILDPGRPSAPAGDDASEAAVQSSLMLEAARRGGALWRNNSGACTDDRGRMVRYGLGNTSAKLNKFFKSSDLIGVTPTQMSDGSIVGVFTAIEVKSPGWTQRPGDDRARAQAAYLNTVRAMGGIGKFAQSVKDIFP